MATTNCSYTDGSNTYRELICSASENCCTSSGSNKCSTSSCSTTSTSSSNSSISPTLFWSILGGLFGAGIILIFLMYIICKFRSPNSCLSDQQQSDAEMFEEECHEINTVSHHPARHPRFYIRRESFWKITRRKSSNPKAICVKCERKQDKNNETPKEDIEMKNNITIIKNLAQQKNVNISPLPDVG